MTELSVSAPDTLPQLRWELLDATATAHLSERWGNRTWTDANAGLRLAHSGSHEFRLRIDTDVIPPGRYQWYVRFETGDSTVQQPDPPGTIYLSTTP